MGDVLTSQLLRMVEDNLAERLMEAVEAHVQADIDGQREPV